MEMFFVEAGSLKSKPIATLSYGRQGRRMRRVTFVARRFVMAAACVMVVVLSGCATVGVEQIEQLKPGTAVVPLSLLGDTLAIRHVGTTVFQNERRDLRVP